MRQTMRLGVAVCLLAVLSLAGPRSAWASVSASNQEPAPTVESLGWLAGTWGSDDQRTEEHWLAPAGGLMVGVNRSIGRSGRAGFEFLRIAEGDGEVVYLAQPGGREPTSFRLVESGPKHAVFANPEHDFPQRIEYRLTEAGDLSVEISGEVDGQSRSSAWSWKRLAGPPPVAD